MAGRIRSISVVVFVPALGWLASAPSARAQSRAAPRAVSVNMIDRSATQFVFEPAQVAVSPGDTVRFVQRGTAPHNVEFKSSPQGSNLGAATMGPFLTAVGQTYELVIDSRFTLGTHEYVCTPHEAMGMRGTITVTNRSATVTNAGRSR